MSTFDGRSNALLTDYQYHNSTFTRLPLALRRFIIMSSHTKKGRRVNKAHITLIITRTFALITALACTGDTHRICEGGKKRRSFKYLTSTSSTQSYISLQVEESRR